MQIFRSEQVFRPQIDGVIVAQLIVHLFSTFQSHDLPVSPTWNYKCVPTDSPHNSSCLRPSPTLSSSLKVKAHRYYYSVLQGDRMVLH